MKNATKTCKGFFVLASSRLLSLPIVRLLGSIRSTLIKARTLRPLIVRDQITSWVTSDPCVHSSSWPESAAAERVGIPLLQVKTPLASTVKNTTAFGMTITISRRNTKLMTPFCYLFHSKQQSSGGPENKSHFSRSPLVRPSLFICGIMKMMNCGANIKCQTM